MKNDICLAAALLAFSASTLPALAAESQAAPQEQIPAAIPATAAQQPVPREDSRFLSQEYAAFRKSQVSNPAYALSVLLEADADLFSGRVIIEFDMAESNVSPLTIDYDAGEVLNVTLNGEAADWHYGRWFISLPPEQFRAGGNTLQIDYRRPFATDGAGLHKFTDPEDGAVYLYTNFEPYDANRLFPHFDQPNLKAPLTLDVTAPAHWTVIANTRESENSIRGESRHWLFPATPPISSYIYALHAGPYVAWEDQAGDIPLRLFSRKSLASYVKTEEWFAPTRQSFAFFQSYFDLPYPFGKYDQIIVPDFNPGAMENVGAVTFNERYVSRGDKSVEQRRSLATIIAHELAHQWFGNLVTMDWWNGLWLNESFATYMAYLALERATEFSNPWDSFYAGAKLWAYETDQLVTTHPIELEVPTTADAFANFDGITYGKGASVLKQLPYLLGEENFRVGISNYLKSHAYQNTSLDDFVGALAEAAGRELEEWQVEWLHRSGVNTMQADFACEGGRLASLQLLQSPPAVETADKILRSQRLQVGLYRYVDGKMRLDSALPVTYRGGITRIPEAEGLPCPHLTLPNEGDWAYIKIKLNETSLGTLSERIGDFDNVTTRLMLWQSQWERAEDGELPLPEFMDFALNNLGAEQEASIARLASDNLSSAFNYFSSLGGYQAEQEAIQNFFGEQLVKAEAGSELQKIWYDSFVAHAHAAPALDYLLELLSGREAIPGLAMDQDKRWELIIAMNRYRHGDYQSLLEQEKARDPSDKGSNYALRAEAIRPEAEMKEIWLKRIIDEPESYKVAALRTAMAALFPPEQASLREAFADRVLAALPGINANANQEYLSEFANALAPAACTPESVARLRRVNGEIAHYQPLLVKAFRIAQQRDQRCVAIGELARISP